MLEFFTELFKSSEQFKFDAGEFSLVLQMFHATGRLLYGHLRDCKVIIFFCLGVLVGLAMRSGVPVYLPLPAAFYEALCCSVRCNDTDYTEDSIKSIQSLMTVSAHCLRTGLVSVYPEVSFTRHVAVKLLIFVVICSNRLRWIYLTERSLFSCLRVEWATVPLLRVLCTAPQCMQRV